MNKLLCKLPVVHSFKKNSFTRFSTHDSYRESYDFQEVQRFIAVYKRQLKLWVEDNAAFSIAEKNLGYTVYLKREKRSEIFGKALIERSIERRIDELTRPS